LCGIFLVILNASQGKGEYAMRNQGAHTLDKFRLSIAAVATIITAMLLPGCGGGGGSPVATNSTSSTRQDFKVTGDASLSSRAAAKGLLYGAATKTSILSNARFSEAFAAQCRMLVPEWELKWNALRPTPDSYDFFAADSLLAFAQSHNMFFRGHTLVWHEELPDWFQSTVTAQNAEPMLRSHIATVVGRYAGKVHSWDVVNEAIEPSQNEPDGLRSSSPWYHLLGPGYIELAFRAAAEADPSALLVYNENWLEYDTPYADAKREAVLKLLTKLKASGTPIHALGIQSHLDADLMQQNFNSVKFKAFLEQVAALGLKIMITEMDVRDRNLPADIATRDQMVADIYYQYLSVVLSEPAVVAVLTWGLSDYNTWNSIAYPRSDGLPVRPLPLDEAMNRKLAWNAIAKAIDGTFTR
jgi:endo-1,4-beta-xylanase